MKKIINKTQKNAGLSLIEFMLALILISLALFAYMSNQREVDREATRNKFAVDVVTILKAFDQKVHVDGYLLKKPTNYVDDVVGRKGTQFEPSFWDNPGNTLLSSATLTGKMYAFDSQFNSVLNKLLVPRGNTTCGAADGWVPVPTKEAKNALLPCSLWSKKIPYDLTGKIYVKFQTTPITAGNESETPSNDVVNNYVNDVFVTFQFKDANAIKGSYSNMSEMVKRMNELSRNTGSTGTMSFYFAMLGHSGGDVDARGLDYPLSPLECFKSPAACLIVGRWSAKAGQENLRLDGMNSIIGSSIDFKLGANQKSDKAMCNRFIRTTDINNDESVPGDISTGVATDEAPKSSWIYQKNIPCGIGISTTTPTPASNHIIAEDQKYSVNTLSGSSNFKGLTLDRKCNNFELGADNLIYNLAGNTPCGIIHSPDGTTDQIIMYANEIQAKEGIFGNAADGSGIGKGAIRSRTMMIQESAILKDISIEGNFNVQKSLNIIGLGKSDFVFSPNNYKAELNAMLNYCNNISSGIGSDKAILAGCRTINSGTLNVAANAVIRGNLQIDGILYQGTQDVNKRVEFLGNVKMGSEKPGTTYADSAGEGIATLCVGHDLYQGDENCIPNTALNPTGGDLIIGETNTTLTGSTGTTQNYPENPNWLVVGGESGSPSENTARSKTSKVTFEVVGSSLISLNKGWNGNIFTAPIPNGFGESGVTPTPDKNQTTSLKVQNNNNGNVTSYVRPEAFDMLKNGDITRTEMGSSGPQTYSFWSDTILPTSVGVFKLALCSSMKIGTIARTENTGEMVTCQKNTDGTKKWQSDFNNKEIKQSSNTQLGEWDLCVLSTLGGLKNHRSCEISFTERKEGENTIRNWKLANNARCQATCIGKINDINKPDTWKFIQTTCGYYNTPDKLPPPTNSENDNSADADFIGGTGTVTPLGTPPVSDVAYAYRVNPTYNPTAWTPNANTQNAGTQFTQTRNVTQDYQQSCYIYEQNEYGNVRVKNAGTGAFGNSQNSGNSNYFSKVIQETQQAIGTKPFIQ